MRSRMVCDYEALACAERTVEPVSPLYPTITRVFEIVFYIVFLIVTVPVLLLISIAINLESKGPVFYRQERMGLHGKTFYVLKLRSMRIDAEKNGPQWAEKNDPRVTRVGRFIDRKSTRLNSSHVKIS